MQIRDRAESYGFGATDKLVQAIRDSGAEVYYRVGRSAGGNLEPPKDFDKYARIVAHIAMHYNQGWAHGFHDHIRYWEIWNEPDSGPERPSSSTRCMPRSRVH